MTIQLLDANDNSPEFTESKYKFRVPENVTLGHKAGTVKAKDIDSGSFGTVTYVLHGFGTDKFRMNSESGDIYVAQSLDYETQKTYTLMIEAKDGGGRVSTVLVKVDLQDVNDNEPKFKMTEYTRIVREGAINFSPQLYIKAMDADGPDQGNGNITYSISEHNIMNNNVLKVMISFNVQMISKN